MEIVLIGSLWVIAAWKPATRTLPFLLFMAATTLLYLIVGMHGHGFPTVVKVILVLAWVAALLWPDRLRVGALSSEEASFDESLRGLERDLLAAQDDTVDGSEQRIARVIRELEASFPPTQAWAHVRDLMVADLRSECDARTPADERKTGFSEQTKQAWRVVRYRKVLRIPSRRR